MEIVRILPIRPGQNTGVVPPWLENPVHILPIPEGWDAPVADGEWTILPVGAPVPA